MRLSPKTLFRTSLFLLVLIFVTVVAFSQTLQWQYSQSSTAAGYDANVMASHTTGVYSAAAVNWTSANKRMVVTKISNSGTLLYTTNFNYGSNVTNIKLIKLITDASGYCYILSQVTFSTGRVHSYVYTYSPTLVLSWVNVVNFSWYNWPADMVLTNNNKLAVLVNYKTNTGVIRDVGIKRLSSTNGSIEQTINFTVSLDKVCTKIKSDVSGNIYFCGYAILGGGDYQSLVVKYNDAGTIQWSKVFVHLDYTSGLWNDRFTDLAIDGSGNVFAAGWGGMASVTPVSGLTEGYVVKFSSTGTQLATGFYKTSDFDQVFYVRLDGSGNVIIAGRSALNRVFFRRFSNALTTVQATGSRIITSGVSIDSWANDCILNPNNSIVIGLTTNQSGTTGNTNATIIKFNSSGGLVFESGINSSRLKAISHVAGSPSPNNEFMLLRNSNASIPPDYWIVEKYTSPASRMTGEKSNTAESVKLKAFPNPSSDIINIKTDQEAIANIEVFDLSGRMVLHDSMTGSDKVLGLAILPKGTYILRYSNEAGEISKTIIKH